jgi:hypothetical protein
MSVEKRHRMNPDSDVFHILGNHDDGETRWMENLGNWHFRSHMLQSLSGVIHAIPVDIDNDGDMDIVSLVSQEWEEVYVFENDGHGNFKSHLVWGSTNEDYGSSGIRLVDLNQDGLVDILLTNGDAFDYLPPRPRPWHSVPESLGSYWIPDILRRVLFPAWLETGR